MKRSIVYKFGGSSVLKENHIDIEMIEQGPAKISFHIGVAQHDADHALEVLHQHLILGV